MFPKSVVILIIYFEAIWGFQEHNTFNLSDNIASQLPRSFTQQEEKSSKTRNFVVPNSNRSGRFLSETIFGLLTFQQLDCASGNRFGSCVTHIECNKKGGYNIGSCAYGLGVCCRHERTCGQTSQLNNTAVVNPGYPSTYRKRQNCEVKIQRKGNTCQLRLEFEDFQMAEPDSYGKCVVDQFYVGGEKKFKYLCGKSPPKWHMYVDVNGTPNPTVLHFDTGYGTYYRRFNIRVTLIPCYLRIPTGCGQYFFGEESGIIQSFNYGSYYIAGMNYGICFRREKAKCKTLLRRLGNSFVGCPDLYRIPIGEPPSTGSTTVASIEIPFCQRASAVGGLGYMANLQSELTTSVNGPLVIWHRSAIDDGLVNYNSNEDKRWAGFYQNFTHQDC